MSRSDTPVVGRTVYTHSFPVTVRVTNQLISSVGSRGLLTSLHARCNFRRSDSGVSAVQVFVVEILLFGVPLVEYGFGYSAQIFFDVQHGHCLSLAGIDPVEYHTCISCPVG